MISGSFVRTHVLPALAARRGAVLFGIGLLFVTTAGTLLTVELSRQLLRLLTANDGSAVAGWGADMARRLGAESAVSEVAWLGGAAIVTGALVYAAMFLRDRTFEDLAIQVTRGLRDRIYAQLLTAPHLTTIEMSVATTVKRLVHDTMVVRDLVVDALLARAADVLMLVGLICYLAMLSPLLTAAVVAAVAGYVYVSFWTARRARSAIRRASDQIEQVSDTAQDGLVRVHDVRLLGREVTEQARFAHATRDEARARMTMVSWLMLDRSLTTYLSWLGPLAILAGGGILTMQGSLEVETLLVFVVAVGLLYASVDNLTALPMKLQRTQVAIENLQRLEALVPVESKPHGGRAPIRPLASAPAVEATGVEYRYPGSALPLRLPGCRIERGGMVGIVGASGAGKSTLIRLLVGMLPGYSGSLRVGGHEAGDAGLERLRDFVGVLPQQAMLFAGTVRDNIAYGAAPGRPAGDDEIRAAAHAAGLAPELRLWPEGLDRRIADQGADLSGGQQRRIALARTLLRQPELLLLDEPLSGISRSDRQLILRAIQGLRSTMTVLVASHDADVLEAADRLLALESAEDERGRPVTVASLGTVAELTVSSRAVQSALFRPRHDVDAQEAAAP